MAEEIKNIQLKFSCNANWEAMPETEGGRQCDKCQKKVHDFTNSKAEEFERILAENNYSICGRFSKTQVTSAPDRISMWKKWASAAMLLIGFNLAACQDRERKATVLTGTPLIPLDTAEQKDVKGEVSPDVIKQLASSCKKVKISPNDVFTSVEVVPVFPGGEKKFMAFMNKHLKSGKTVKRSRVHIAFIIEKDGSLSNIKPVGPSTDPAALKEAIRVLKLSPRWIPGKQNNEPVRVQYVVPVIFN
ncbi:energy transducer TonB [Mucilaginibacter sp. PAMB04274]|uniref:energy transducer TonB n=1 Tax=Mucilaginibacter sp. PAMB04274 TaxID=3138568 RepID=UPI0031F70E43